MPADAVSHPGQLAPVPGAGGVGVVCGLLIVSVFVLTGPVIARNEAAALQQAVFGVLPGRWQASFGAGEDGHFRPAAADDAAHQMVHAGYDANGGWWVWPSRPRAWVTRM